METQFATGPELSDRGLAAMLRTAFAISACLFAVIPARAQVEKLPPYLQETLAQIGPVFQKDIRKTIPATIEAFQPLLKSAPKDGVTITRNEAYGEDPRQILDVYRPTARSGAPIVIFVHGGAYVRGDKDAAGEAYGNIAIWFARQGLLGINATYPLAPAAKWPAGAKNVGGMVAWAKANAARFGGDPGRIILIGHSAGATHVAGYVFDKSLQPPDGPGIAGAVLISGRYQIDYDGPIPMAAICRPISAMTHPSTQLVHPSLTSATARAFRCSSW